MDLTFKDEEVLNLQSDFYLLEKKDKKYLQEYLNHIMYDLICGMKKGDVSYIKETYCHIVTLIEYAIWNSKAIFFLSAADASEEAIDNAVRLLLERYMDSIEGDKGFYDRFGEMAGISEQDLRMFCHKSFGEYVKNAVLSVKQDFPDFLEKRSGLEDLEKERKEIVVEGEFGEDSKKAIEIALNYIGNKINIEKCIFAVQMIYENFHEEGDASAYKYIEGVLFRLYELKYYMLPSDSNVDRLKYTTDDDYYTQCNHKYKATWDTEAAIKIFEKAEQHLKKEEYAQSAEWLQPDGVFNLGCSIKLGELIEKNEEIGTTLMQSVKMLDNEEVKEFVQGVAREIVGALEKAVYNIPL